MPAAVCVWFILLKRPIRESMGVSLLTLIAVTKYMEPSAAIRGDRSVNVSSVFDDRIHLHVDHQIYKTYYVRLIKPGTVSALVTFLLMYIRGDAGWKNPFRSRKKQTEKDG